MTFNGIVEIFSIYKMVMQTHENGGSLLVLFLKKKKNPASGIAPSGRSGRPSSPRVLPCLSSFMKYFCACVRTCARDKHIVCAYVHVRSSGETSAMCTRSPIFK